MKVARAVVLAVLILLMAVTPLSALISPGHFEVQFAERDRLSGHRVTVTLDDKTGLARGLSAWTDSRVGDGVAPSSDGRILVVNLTGGCGTYLIELAFERASTGYVLRERTHESGCSFLILVGWTVAIHLWAPVDASTVEFVSTP